jgi:protein tyrosine/serine phosphatase
MAALQSSGPDQFAMVSTELYRGGAPSAEDLEYLRALGVVKIVDLRREDLGKRRAERAEARRLGLEYVEYPFYGKFGTDLAFLDGLMADLATHEPGAVYVHCSSGRDRTSLAVALYRIVYDGWSADLAWEREALAYGHKRSLFNREIELTFQDYAHEQTLRRQTANASGSRVRAVSAALGGPTGGALVHTPSDQRPAAP